MVLTGAQIIIECLKEQGVDTPELVDRLICLAFERAQEREARKC